VSNNRLEGTHRWAARVTAGASSTLVTGNQVARATSAAFAAIRADDNVFRDNDVSHTPTGLLIEDATGNRFDSNQFSHLGLSAATVRGEARDTVIVGNVFHGHGANDFSADGAIGFDPETARSRNDLSSWLYPPPPTPRLVGVAVWVLVLLIPLLMRIVHRRLPLPKQAG
jgi:hypothetical protein